MPATVDSAAIAGMMDLLRVQGSFVLAVRYTVCFQLNQSPMSSDSPVPSMTQYELLGKVFERKLDQFVTSKNILSLEELSSNKLRESLCLEIKSELLDLNAKASNSAMEATFNVLINYMSFQAEQGDLGRFVKLTVELFLRLIIFRLFFKINFSWTMTCRFVKSTVDAFLDNDLLHALRIFLEHAKGSFGLCVTSSLDAKRQAVFAAKGQTLSIAFYPRKGIICYGSEQAAVKAGLNYETPNGPSKFSSSYASVDERAVRLDLDDLGGEICLLDWGYANDKEPAISPPNRGLTVDKLMGGAVSIVLLHQQNAMNKSSKLHKRLVQLENNEFIKPLLDDCGKQANAAPGTCLELFLFPPASQCQTA